MTKPLRESESPADRVLPLQGVRVLSLEQVGAGPFGSLHLVNLGAEVIKIEDPTAGDISRVTGPYFQAGEDPTSAGLYFQALNMGKKSVTIDIREPRGQEAFHKLVATADAVTSNLRGDVPAKLGLTYEILSKVNPAIVCGHLTGYGREGERASWPGYDYIMQAQAGYCSVTGDPGSPPTRFGLSIIDWMAGLSTALGVVSGILGARETGLGGDVDVSLFDVALYNLNYVGVWQLNTTHKQGKEIRGGHPSAVPSQMFKTKDGWIYVMVAAKQKHWQIFCEIVGHPEWVEDPRFATAQGRLVNRDKLTELVDEALSVANTDAWMAKMTHRIAAAPVLDVESALNNPYVHERGLIRSVKLEGGSELRTIRNPIRWSGRTAELHGAPALGQNTDEELRSAGLSIEEIEVLRADGVI